MSSDAGLKSVPPLRYKKSQRRGFLDKSAQDDFYILYINRSLVCPSYQSVEAPEKMVGIMRAGGCFGVILQAHHRF